MKRKTLLTFEIDSASFKYENDKVHHLSLNFSWQQYYDRIIFLRTLELLSSLDKNKSLKICSEGSIVGASIVLDNLSLALINNGYSRQNNHSIYRWTFSSYLFLILVEEIEWAGETRPTRVSIAIDIQN